MVNARESSAAAPCPRNRRVNAYASFTLSPAAASAARRRRAGPARRRCDTAGRQPPSYAPPSARRRCGARPRGRGCARPRAETRYTARAACRHACRLPRRCERRDWPGLLRGATTAFADHAEEYRRQNLPVALRRRSCYSSRERSPASARRCSPLRSSWCACLLPLWACLRFCMCSRLLGPGDRTDKWQDWHLIYHLGPERRGLFRIDWGVARDPIRSVWPCEGVSNCARLTPTGGGKRNGRTSRLQTL